MNAGRMITNIVRRYASGTRRPSRRRPNRPNPGVQQTLDGIEDDGEVDFTDMENFDVEDAEADFTYAHRNYSSHKK